jgi:hypothetical protein
MQAVAKAMGEAFLSLVFCFGEAFSAQNAAASKGQARPHSRTRQGQRGGTWLATDCACKAMGPGRHAKPGGLDATPVVLAAGPAGHYLSLATAPCSCWAQRGYLPSLPPKLPSLPLAIRRESRVGFVSIVRLCSYRVHQHFECQSVSWLSRGGLCAVFIENQKLVQNMHTDLDWEMKTKRCF